MDQKSNPQGQQSEDQDGSSDLSEPTGIGQQRNERNSGGISNRDMDEQQEQADLPERGTERQSER